MPACLYLVQGHPMLPSTTHFHPPVASPGPRSDPMSGFPNVPGQLHRLEEFLTAPPPKVKGSCRWPQSGPEPCPGREVAEGGAPGGSPEAERKAGTGARWTSRNRS